MGGPGKTAPLLLQDLLTYDARYERAAGRNLLTSSRPHYDSQAAATHSVPQRNCRHDFQLKEEQSELPDRGISEDRYKNTYHADLARDAVYRVAVYCRKCCWHFDVVVEARDDGVHDSPCTKTNHDFPLHHFLYQGEQDQDRHESLGGQNKARTYHFTCSSPKCPVHLRIRIAPPRLSDSDITLLTDPANLRRRWERSRQIDGDRVDADMAQPIDAPNFLSTYLHDSLNPKPGKNRIPLLNRKFLKTFGRDCDDILKKLGFTAAVEQDQDGNGVEVWYLPKPPPAQDPLADNYERTIRNVIEDARYELNTLILRFPESERSSARRNPMALTPARNYIELALGCHDYELRAGGRRETRSATHEEDHPYYAGLGALADFSDSLLIFSYNRQVEVDKTNTPYYYECLKDLAIGRESLSMQTHCSVLESNGLVTRHDLIKAYRTLNIDPAHVHALSDEIITNQFKSRIMDVGAKTAEECRAALRIVGNARNSEIIKRTASNSIETYEDALSWLDLPGSAMSDDDFVISMFTAKTTDNPAEIETGRKAVKIIADHRKSRRLWMWLETGHMAAAGMDTAEAYATLNITDRSAQLDPSMLQTQLQMMITDNPENADRLRLAHEKVRQDQEATYGTSYHESAQPTVEYPLETWPVGCCNIGNTCYLNSVLQFLFTVKPLREMVLECDKHMQDLSPEALKQKLVGRTAVSRARAETGQQFVRELQALFQHMITAPTHNVRPERSLAALALTKGESTSFSAENDNNDTAGSGLGKIGDLPISGPMPPPACTSRPTSPADSVMGDAEGDTDSMKAMDLTAASSESNGLPARPPEPPSRPPPIPPRPQAKPDIGLKKLEDVALQQDAAEILNNVFDLLSCAFQGESILRDGEQEDLIKRLFFSDVTTVRKTKDKDNTKTDLQDNVLVSTKDRDRSLYAALDDEFGLTELEGGVAKYEFLEEASPIQIINVRRLQYEDGKPRKDESHLALDKVMYMDRYLKETRSIPEGKLQELRYQQWQLQQELRSLESRKKVLKETDFKDVDLPGVLDETACLVTQLNGHSVAIEEHDDNSSRTQSKVSNHLNQRADELRPELSEIHERMDALEKEIDSVFAHCKDHPYRLHAIFMHAGSHSGGHYWIYIYDFQNNIWRKYNDETVTEISEEDVLKKVVQNRPPTSTGIVYVREDVVARFTEAVCRQPDASAAQNGENGDVVMADADPGRVVHMDTEFANLPVINGVEA